MIQFFHFLNCFSVETESKVDTRSESHKFVFFVFPTTHTVGYVIFAFHDLLYG